MTWNKNTQDKIFCVFSRSILKIPYLHFFFDSKFVYFNFKKIDLAGWGYKKNTTLSRFIANSLNLNYVALEDGFLRSFGSGADFPPLAMVIGVVAQMPVAAEVGSGDERDELGSG